ncbi:hypothetical protein, partial [Roseovarius amoyensis]|uniref:hypothetical protein n=1 Tax=Roseovarius amoyensis TaxID=2211448 RepID=UPI0019550C17
MDNSIGLHIYSITQHKTRKPKKIAFSENGDGARLLRSVPHFIKKYKSAEWLCCTNWLRDSLFESSVIAGCHEQLVTYEVQDQELAFVQHGA